MQPRRYLSLVSVLRRRMESCDLTNPDKDQLVDYLCNNYPDYSRAKRRWLSKQVTNFLLESSSRKSTSTGNSGSSVSDLVSAAEEENYGPKRKKAKKSQQLEEEDGMSTSGDQIYAQEYEPEFDLLNSQLREKYVTSVKTGKDKNAGNAKFKAKLLNDGGGRERGARRAMVKKGLDGGGTGPMFKDLGGMRDVIDDLSMNVIAPFYHPEFQKRVGVKPKTGILLHGPPGCGKTKLAHAIANEAGVPFYNISATELVSSFSGDSEENIRELFAKAYRTAPSVVFIDEIDAIGSKREDLSRETDRRIVTQLMMCMDESHRPENSGVVLVIGATNRPDAVDPAVRRRFDREILLGVPDECARAEILSAVTRHLNVVGTLDLQKLARATPGFVGADLAALADTAGDFPMKRVICHRKRIFGEHADGSQAFDWLRQRMSCEEMEQAYVTMEDFENAVGMVQPSSKREGFSAIPNVKWEDVGGLQELRQVFERKIIKHLKFPELYEYQNMHSQPGFLLFGPPGCGKTSIAQAVAHEAGANFIYIKGPELLDKYVGESEKAIRTIFSRARTCAPCILFFDEVDALTTKRGEEGGEVVGRFVNQLKSELDGVEKRRGIYVIGATNRPEDMDDGLLRPERFGEIVYVPLPSAEERGLILTTLARNKQIDTGVDLMAIGRACKNFSGADLSALMDEATEIAIEEVALEDGKGDPRSTITESHFMQAMSKITPSVNREQRRHYRRLSKLFKAS